jgi:hypothetical protein
MPFWRFVGNRIALCCVDGIVKGEVPDPDRVGCWVTIAAPPAQMPGR